VDPKLYRLKRIINDSLSVEEGYLEKGILGEETVRQVCPNDQRFNVNVVMYSTF